MSDAAEKLLVACPKCGKQYRVARTMEGKQGRCSCGSEFTLQAAAAPAAIGEVPSQPPAGPATAAVAAPVAPAPVAAHCVQHPDVPAAFACARCRALICQICDFPQPDGSHLCPMCAFGAGRPTSPWQAAGPAVSASAAGGPVNPYAPPAPGIQPGYPVATAGPFAAPAPPLAGQCCGRHPEVAAVVRCRNCMAPICPTCDFQFPGGLHYCPSCATNTSRPLSSTRKSLVVWSMVLAGWVTLFLVILLSGVMAEAAMDEVGAMIIGSLIMIPGLIGIGLACGSLDKRAGNPPIVWVTVIWNGILMGVWILLCIIGLMMGGGM